ncbi:MAG TPA: GDSL-type esterase/lipase family protein [Actinomycetota bacterium]|nr:GDSL-type esterase/lipase family protein [Actinomycetota bacterium]
MLKKLLLAVASMIFTVGLVEVGFRLAGYRPIYDVYSKPEAFWKADSTLGWTLEPNSTGTYVGPRPFPILFRTPIRINSLGLRGPEPTPVPEGGHRVVFLGDSQTAGFEVPEDRTFAHLAGEMLQERLGAPVQAINAGVRGYGTDQALLLFRQRLRELQPEVVIYDKVINDAEDNTTLHRPKRPFGKAAFVLDDDGTLRLEGAPVPDYPFCSSVRLDESFRVRRQDGLRTRSLCWLETNLSDRFAAFSFVATRLRQNPDLLRRLWNTGQPGQPAAVPPTQEPRLRVAAAAEPPPPLPEGLPEGVPEAQQEFAHRLTSALIRQLSTEVREAGARFVMVASDPDLAQLDVAGFQAAGIQILRADSVLGADQSPYRIPNDGHLNAEGHRRVAGLIAPAVESLLAP